MINRKFKKILITGINGSVGSYLSEYILKIDKSLKIFGTYRSKNLANLKNVKKEIKLIKNDLNNFRNIKSILKKIKPDLIYHLASNADVRKSFDKPKEIILNNNNCTLNLLEGVRQLKINPLIIVCSTSEIYGDPKRKYINENTKINPNNPYAVSKAFQDLVSQVYFKCFNLNIIITRMFTYLNARRTNLFASHWAKQIVEIERGRKKRLEHGNLDTFRSIIDVRDAMRAYWLVAKHGKIGEAYNIGGGKNMKLSKFLKILKQKSKVRIRSKINPKLLRKTDIKIQIPSYKKFKKDTNWEPLISFKDSLEYFLNENRENTK